MSGVPEHIAKLIRDGRKIEAIKLLREETGVDLQTAKEAVDRMDADPLFDPIAEPVEPGEFLKEVRALAEDGKMIEAVVLYRQQTGMGLKNSIQNVEQLVQDPSLPAPNLHAPLVAAVIAIALLGVGIALLIFLLGPTP